VRSATIQLGNRVRLLPLAVAAALASYLLLRGMGPAGLVLVAVAAAFAVGLGFVLRGTDAASRSALLSPIATGALLVTPALATLYLSFSSGGFYADSVAFCALVALVLFVVRCALAEDPLHGLGRAAFVPATALALLGAWTILSGVWSDSPGRALLEADRILLYLVVLLLFASVGRTSERLGFAVRAMATAIVLVAGLALLSRVAPDVFSTSESFVTNRLSFPLTYWNALGVFCAIGMVLCLHLTASASEPRPVRVLAAGALPVLGATLLLTFSRGGIGAAVLGLVVYAVAGHPRGLLTGLLAAAPTTAIAVMSAYDATLLAGDDPTSPAAVAQGHDVAQTVIWCVVAAVLVRAVLLLADARLERVRPSVRAVRGGVAAGLVAIVVLALVVDAPGVVADRVDEFLNQSRVGATEQTRERLSSTSAQGRVELWEAGLEGFEADRLKGSGAGTYFAVWTRHGDNRQSVVDAHSVYVETLAELGLVGILLLVVALVALLVGLVPFRRGPDRCVYAAIFAAAIAWGAHAGFDWDWEMSAVTLPVFALAGLAVARSADAPPRRRTGGVALAAIGLLALAVAVLPALVLASQQRLDASVEALRDGDCRAAIAEARRAVDALDMRPEAHEVIGLCRARQGEYRLAAAAFERALERDPDNWALHTSLAAVLAASGRDPRPEAREGVRLNPLEPYAADVMTRLRGSRPARWRRAGRALARSLPPSGRW
jgi:hypothetical protein